MATKTWKETMDDIWESNHGYRPTYDEKLDAPYTPPSVTPQETVAPTTGKVPAYDKNSLWENFTNSNMANLGNMLSSLSNAFHDSDRGSVQSREDIVNNLKARKENWAAYLFRTNGMTPADLALGKKPVHDEAELDRQATQIQLQQGQKFSDTKKTYFQEKLADLGDKLTKNYPLHQVDPDSLAGYAQALGSVAPSAVTLAGLVAVTGAALRSGNSTSVQMVPKYAEIMLTKAGASQRVAQAGAVLASAGVVGWMQNAPEAYTEGQDAFEKAVKAGKSQQEADKIRDKVILDNILLLTPSNAIEQVLGSSVKIPAATRNLLKRMAAKSAPVVGNMVQNSLEEGGQSAIQSLAAGEKLNQDEIRRSMIVGGIAGGAIPLGIKAGNYAANKVGNMATKNKAAIDNTQSGTNTIETAVQNVPTNQADTSVSGAANQNLVNAESIGDIVDALTPAERAKYIGFLSTKDLSSYQPSADVAQAIWNPENNTDEQNAALLKQFGREVPELANLSKRAAMPSEVGNPNDILQEMLSDQDIPGEVKDNIKAAVASGNEEQIRDALNMALPADANTAAVHLASKGATHKFPDVAKTYIPNMVESAQNAVDYGEGSKPVTVSDVMMPAPVRKQVVEWVRANGKPDETGRIVIKGNSGSFSVNATGNPGLKFTPNQMNDAEVAARKVASTQGAFENYRNRSGQGGKVESDILAKLNSPETKQYEVHSSEEAAAVTHVAAKNNIRLGAFKKVNGKLIAKKLDVDKKKPASKSVPVTQEIDEPVQGKMASLNFGSPEQNENLRKNSTDVFSAQKPAKQAGTAPLGKKNEAPPANPSAKSSETSKTGDSGNNKLNSGIDPFQLIPGLRKYNDMTVKEAWQDLKRIGISVYESGITNGQKWTTKMKELLGEMWEKVRPFIGKLWKEVKATLAESRGAVGKLTERQQEIRRILQLDSKSITQHLPNGVVEKDYRKQLADEFNGKRPVVQQPVKTQTQQAVKPEPQKTTKPETQQRGKLAFETKPSDEVLLKLAKQKLREGGGNFRSKKASMKYMVGDKFEYFKYGDDGIAGIAYDGFNKISLMGGRFESVKDAFTSVFANDAAVNLNNLTHILQTVMSAGDNAIYRELRELGGASFIEKSMFIEKYGDDGRPVVKDYLDGFGNRNKGKVSPYLQAMKTAYENIQKGVPAPALQTARASEKTAVILMACQAAGVDMPLFGSEKYNEFARIVDAISRKETIKLYEEGREGNTPTTSVIAGDRVSEEDNMVFNIARVLKKDIVVLDRVPRIDSKGRKKFDYYVSRGGSLLTSARMKDGQVDWENTVIPEGAPVIKERGKAAREYKTRKSGTVSLGHGSIFQNKFPGVDATTKMFAAYRYLQEMPLHVMNTVKTLSGATLPNTPQGRVLASLYQNLDGLPDGEHAFWIDGLSFNAEVAVTIKDGEIISKQVSPDLSTYRAIAAEEGKKKEEIPDYYDEEDYRTEELGAKENQYDTEGLTPADKMRYEMGISGKRKTSDDIPEKLESKAFEPASQESVVIETDDLAGFKISDKSTFTKVTNNILFKYDKPGDGKSSDASYIHVISPDTVFLSLAEAEMAAVAQNGFLPTMDEFLPISNASDFRAINLIKQMHMETADDGAVRAGQVAIQYLASKYANMYRSTYRRLTGKTISLEEAQGKLAAYEKSKMSAADKASNIVEAALLSNSTKVQSDWHGRFANVITDMVMDEKRSEKRLDEDQMAIASRIRKELNAKGISDNLAEVDLTDYIVAVKQKIQDEISQKEANKNFSENSKDWTQKQRMVLSLDAAITDNKKMSELRTILKEADESVRSIDYTSEDDKAMQLKDESSGGFYEKLMKQHYPDITNADGMTRFKNAVDKTMKKLNQFQRDALYLHVAGMNNSDIARTVGGRAGDGYVSVFDVETAIEMAKERLAEEVGGVAQELRKLHRVDTGKVQQKVEAGSSVTAKELTKKQTAESTPAQVAKKYEVAPPAKNKTQNTNSTVEKKQPNIAQTAVELKITKMLNAVGIGEVIFFDDPNGPNGMYTRESGHGGAVAKRQIHINRSAKHGVIWAAGHELGHYILDTNKGLVDVIAKSVGITQAQVDARHKNLNDRGYRMSKSEVMEEMICDSFGNSVLYGNDKLFTRLFNEDKPAYVKVMRSAVKFVRWITGRNKATGLTQTQANKIEDTLFAHLGKNFHIQATGLHDFQNLLDYHYANEIARAEIEGRFVSKRDKQEAEELMQKLSENGYRYTKLSLDSETVAGTWFGKMRGVISRFTGPGKPANVTLANRSRVEGELNVLYHFISPNMVVKHSKIFSSIHGMALRASDVNQRLQTRWTERQRGIFSKSGLEMETLASLFNSLDKIKREPVMSVQLGSGKYVLLGLSDKMVSVSKAGTAEKIAAELRQKGFKNVEVIKESVVRNEEEYTSYTVVGFKNPPMQYFDDFKTAKQNANVASVEALRRGISFGEGEKGFTLKPNEATVEAYRELRALFDEIHEQINLGRQALGLDSIGYIHGYMPHMFDDYWVYTSDDKSPVQTFRNTTDAIEFAKELTENNRIYAEANMEQITPKFRSLVKAYYGIGAEPVTNIGELAKKLGKDAAFVYEGMKAMKDANFPNNEISICSRPVNLSTSTETATTAFATGDLLEEYEVRKLLEKEGMTLKDFEMRYGVLENVSEYRGAQRSPAIIKGRASDSGGYISDLTTITSRYISQAARYVALNPFKIRSTALFKSYFGASVDVDFSKNSTAQVCKSYIQFVNGDPGWLDHKLGELIDSGVRNSKVFAKAYDLVGGRDMVNHILFFTSVTKLGLNAASAVLNFTQLANAMAVVGTRHVGPAFGKAFGIYRAMQHGKGGDFTDKTTGLPVDELFRMFHLDTQVDLSGSSTIYDNALPDTLSLGFLPKAAKLAKTDPQGFAYEMGNRSLGFFKWTDALARIATCFGTLEKEYPAMLAKVKAENPSMSEQEAKRIAIGRVAELADYNNRICNFDNSSADSALIFHHTGKLGAVLLQFKKYQMKTMELLCRTFPGRNGTKEEWQRFGSLLAWQAVLSGMYGIPVYSLILSVLGYAFDWEDPEVEFKREIWRAFGGSPLGQAFAGHITYGIGYHGSYFGIGADLSHRTGYDFLKPNDVTKFLDGGPFLGTINAFRKIVANNTHLSLDAPFVDASGLWKVKGDAMMQVFPGLGGFMLAAEGSKYSTEGRARLTYNYSDGERVIRALGARPINEARTSDADRYAYYLDKNRQEMQKRVITRAANYLESGKPFPASLNEDMVKWGVKMSRVNAELNNRNKPRSERSQKSAPKSQRGEIKDYYDIIK